MKHDDEGEIKTAFKKWLQLKFLNYDFQGMILGH